MSKTKQFVFFDLGDTLISLKKSHVGIIQLYLKEHKIILPTDVIKKSFIAANTGLNISKVSNDYMLYLKQAAKFIKECNLGSENITKIADVLHRVNEYKRNENNWKLEPKAYEVLNYLKQRYKLAIISNWDFSFNKIINHFGFNEYMQFCICSHDVGYSKPSQEIFNFALLRAGLSNNHNSIYIGDNYEFDIVASQKCGFTSYLYNKKSKNYDCDSFSSLEQLKNIL